MTVNKKQQVLHARRRMEIIIGSMTLGLFMLLIRAVDLHILQGDELKERAYKQHFHQYDVVAPRGAIHDRHGRILSKSIEVPSITALASEIPEKDLPKLAQALKISLSKLQSKIKNRHGFTWLARQVSPAIAERVAALNIPGVHQESEWRRYHPLGPETGHFLGFVGIDGQGLEGIERSMNQHLQGKLGTRLMQRDARGHSLPDGVWLQQPRIGKALTLTIDSNIQSIAYAALSEGIRKQRAKSGSVVVMNPHNGDILAMASWPSFNPNSFSRYRPSQWRNRAITDIFEPGSTMKAFTVASALESKNWQADSLIFCEQGSFRVANYIIHDDHPEGWLDLTGIIAQSSNIGAAKLAINIGARQLQQHLSSFGFGEKTGIDLGGESAGILLPTRKWGIVETANIAFGQGIATTPLQLAAAFSILANHGIKQAPHLVLPNETIPSEALKRVPSGERVISKKTSDSITQMLIAATAKNATGWRAVPAGYHVAGKTGTAQKANNYGGYAKNKYTAVFAGFAPAEAPEIVIVVVIDEPQQSIYGGTVAAPIFRNIAATTLPYLGALPETQTASWQTQRVATSLTQPPIAGMVGNFSHLSLRQAYQQADQQGYTLRSHGSGWVTKQSPAPLVALSNGSEVEVWLNE
ncbi:MAG: penicillin-binding transpeptidase domain-containing protein [Mariprofundaceae bacterium]|nr:penicillin-binding transpeptidase domain-containing protein [Mariprofundaceae bacterium]